MDRCRYRQIQSKQIQTKIKAHLYISKQIQNVSIHFHSKIMMFLYLSNKNRSDYMQCWNKHIHNDNYNRRYILKQKSKCSLQKGIPIFSSTASQYSSIETIEGSRITRNLKFAISLIFFHKPHKKEALNLQLRILAQRMFTGVFSKDCDAKKPSIVGRFFFNNP